MEKGNEYTRTKCVRSGVLKLAWAVYQTIWKVWLANWLSKISSSIHSDLQPMAIKQSAEIGAVHEEIYETISQCTLEYALSHISPACSN